MDGELRTEIWQLFEPPCIPPMSIECDAVLELMAPVDVAVAMVMSIIMSPWATMLVYTIPVWGVREGKDFAIVVISHFTDSM